MLLAQYYDCLVDWNKRLGRELPFLKRLIPGRRVLVAACGTGGHLPALAQAGFDEAGIDSSAEMGEAARLKGAGRVEQMPLERCSGLGRSFDAVLCLGNVLPGLSEPNQNLNYDRRWREKTRFFPLLSGRRVPATGNMGCYGGEPFDIERSGDLLLAAWK